jgi:hypothetical protein
MWALDIARTTAMSEAGTNKPSGWKYSQAFAKWLRCHSEFEPIGKLDKADRSRLFECLENLEAINAWRATLPPHHLLKLNYPPTVLRRWKQSIGPAKPPPSKTSATGSATAITTDMILAWLEQASPDAKHRIAKAIVPGIPTDVLLKMMSPTTAAEMKDRVLMLNVAVASRTASARPTAMGRTLGALLSHIKANNPDRIREAADGLRRLLVADGCDPDDIREARIKTAKRA